MSRTRLAPVSTESAYRVPWLFERGAANFFTLRNLGQERLTAVSFNLYISGHATSAGSRPAAIPASAPSTLEPGDSLEIVVSGRDLARDTVGVIRWFRPNGQEYLWRVSF